MNGLLLPIATATVFGWIAEHANEEAPSWTNKEVLIAIGSVVAALIPVILFVIKLTTSLARAKARKATADKAKLQAQLDALQKPVPPDNDLSAMTKKLQDAQQ